MVIRSGSDSNQSKIQNQVNEELHEDNMIEGSKDNASFPGNSSEEVDDIEELVEVCANTGTSTKVITTAARTHLAATRPGTPLENCKDNTVTIVTANTDENGRLQGGSTVVRGHPL